MGNLMQNTYAKFPLKIHIRFHTFSLMNPHKNKIKQQIEVSHKFWFPLGLVWVLRGNPTHKRRKKVWWPKIWTRLVSKHVAWQGKSRLVMSIFGQWCEPADLPLCLHFAAGPRKCHLWWMSNRVEYVGNLVGFYFWQVSGCHSSWSAQIWIPGQHDWWWIYMF